MNITRKQKTVIRHYLRRNPEVLLVRVMRDGAVRAYGKAPYATVWRWFDAGRADNLLIEADLVRRMT